MKAKTNLRRIVLLGFMPSKKKCVRVLKVLYQEYLQFDPMWHFFWEGNVTYLRVSKNKDLTILLQILDKHKIKHEIDDKDWVDNIKITELYQESFAHIFHGFSTMAMELSLVKDKSLMVNHLFRIIERIHHCFMNVNAHQQINYQHAIDDCLKSCGPDIGEAMIMCLAVFRGAFFSGRISK